ncbi:MAG: PDZ domain-containing protein, partial [Alphaproteobacteria bacterium]
IVAETPIDKDVDVEIWRKGKKKTIKVAIGELKESAEKKSSPPESSQKDTIKLLGLTLSSITPKLRKRYKLEENTKGVIITAVEEPSPAKKKGLRIGDVILEISQDKVSAPAEVLAKVKSARSAKRKSVLMLIERQNDQRFVVLPIGKK